MKESLGEKLKRVLSGKKNLTGAGKKVTLQPDILDVAKQDEVIAEAIEAAEELTEKTPVSVEEISEEGPRFSSEDLAQMSEGSWRPEETDISELLVEVPEQEVPAAVAETPDITVLKETAAEDSAVIEDLTTQMDSMAFFAPEPEKSLMTEEQLFDEPVSDSEAPLEELPEEVLEETAEEIVEEVSEEIQEEVPEEISEETEQTEEIPEEQTEELISEEETEAAEEEPQEEPVSEDEPEAGEDAEVSEESAAEEEEISESSGEETEEAQETEQESTETEAEEIAEDTEEAAEAETETEVLEDTGREAEIAKNLTDLWGLDKTPEEIEKEKKKERRRRFFSRVAVLLVLLGIAGSGAYAYEQGWRINLFYEVQNTSESDSTENNGRKKRPDSSEFADKDNKDGSGLSYESLTGDNDIKERFSILERLEQLLQNIPDVMDTENETGTGAQETKEPENTSNTKTEEKTEPEPEKELVGINVSKEDDPAKISEEGPTGALEEPDKVTVEETGPIQTVEVERAANYYLSADGSVREIRALPTEIKTAQDLLNKANVKLNKDDIIEPSLDSAIAEGDTVKITRIVYRTVTETETIPGVAIERMTPVLRSGRTYAINQNNQADGEKEVVYKEKYVDGVLESREEISSTVIKEPTDYILLVGANIAASPINGAQYTDIQILNGVPAEYSAVYSGRCTAYNFRKGSYGASGMYLSQGMVAVDPSLIPYGSLLYITNSDGSFVYGWAIAADYCEASAAGDAVVDLFFDTYRECTLFGARSLNVYVVKQLTQSDLSQYVAKEGMFRNRVPA